MILILLAWIISPFVLLPLFISKCSECSRLAKQNLELLEQLRNLQRESSGTVPTQASEQSPQTPENQAYNPNPYLESQPYNLPQYNIPNAPIRSLPPAPEKPEPIFNGKAETAYAPPPAAVGETHKKSVSTINII
ncbi:MAG: hypothetical protein K2G87_11860, partial [Oscillospiraceae bacterium]|nr:hypothetical protein [Oscillospiraceae bacterium]